MDAHLLKRVAKHKINVASYEFGQFGIVVFEDVEKRFENLAVIPAFGFEATDGCMRFRRQRFTSHGSEQGEQAASSQWWARAIAHSRIFVNGRIKRSAAQ